MKTFLFFVLSMCIITKQVNAGKTDDILYLKNGSIVHGIILVIIPNQSIKIQTTDHRIFVFKMDEVEKITKSSPGFNWNKTFPQFKKPEDVVYLKNGIIMRGNILEIILPENVNIQVTNNERLVLKMDEIEKIDKSIIEYNPADDHDWVMNLDLGYRAGIGNAKSTFNQQSVRQKNSDYGLSLRLSNDYKFTDQYLLGLGIGFERYFSNDLYSGIAFIPVFIDTKFLFFTKSDMVPSLDLSIGYDIGLTTDETTLADYSGGLFINPALSFYIASATNTSLNFKFGYEYQSHSIIVYQIRPSIETTSGYLTLSAGMKF